MNDEYAYNSVTVATYVVALANSKKLGINMTKIQKLLYIAYGVYLVVKKSRLEVAFSNLISMTCR